MLRRKTVLAVLLASVLVTIQVSAGFNASAEGVGPTEADGSSLDISALEAAASGSEHDGYLIGVPKEAALRSLSAAADCVAGGIYHVDTAAEAVEFAQTYAVTYIEPNYYIELLSDDLIDDPAVLEAIYTAGGARGAMKAGAAADANLNGIGVRVAVIDNGLDLGFGDFDVNNTERYTIYNDGMYYDAALPDANHGTYVADVIAGINGNNIGADGVAPGATLLSIKAFNRLGCTVANLLDALTLAVNLNADVINISLGTSEKSTALESAIAETTSSGVIVVAAAGNSGRSGNPVMYPASYDGVVSVGAAGSDYTRQSYSEYNAFVDCLAPGTVVFRTEQPGGSAYTAITGTSFAAPAVAAAAALLKQNDPALTSAGFEALLEAKCMDLGDSGRDVYYGFGFLRIDWCLSDDAALCDVIVSDGIYTLTAVAQAPEIRIAAGAAYAPNGRMTDADMLSVPVGGFCRTYGGLHSTEKLFFLSADMQPVCPPFYYQLSTN
jgi:subtilisin